MPDITVLQALEGGLALIRENGWYQGNYEDEATGALCVIGGIKTAAGESFGCPLYDETPLDRYAAQIAEHYPDWVAYHTQHAHRPDWNACEPFCLIASWNDEPGRTQAEVETMYEKAIVKEAEHA